MRAWGLNLFQSDYEYDIVGKLDVEAGLDKLQDDAIAKVKAKACKAGRSEKARAKDAKAKVDEEDCGIHYSLYAELCSDVQAVRKHLDGGVLKSLIDTYTAKSNGTKDKKEWFSSEYILVMLCACAMSLGCKLPPDFKVLVGRLYTHVNLMAPAVKQMSDALMPGVYTDGLPYDWGESGSLDLETTADADPRDQCGLNVYGMGTLFEPRVPAPTYPHSVCGGCGASSGDGNGERLLACSKCKIRKYCSRDCQKIHWSVHKKACKAPMAGD